MKIIGYIQTDFPTKFGVPRQSGVIPESHGRIVFEKEYRDTAALRGIEEFSHIWVIWEFSEAKIQKWSPTVRPPLLGGNKRVGVFATRSPFRPNPIGLSVLKLEGIERLKKEGLVLHVSGCDMMNGTPIYDIKPYLPYADSIPDATGGFTESLPERCLTVEVDEAMLKAVREEKRGALLAVLKGDPRPSYQCDPNRIYSFEFADVKVKFKVSDRIVTVESIEKL